MKVVLDTNVLVSGNLKAGTPPERVLGEIFSSRWTCLVTNRILAEYEEVLKREKFGFPAFLLHEQLDFFRTKAIRFADIASPAGLPDPKDLIFLSAARHGKADVLVTGNKKHFPSALCAPVRVLNPSESLLYAGTKKDE